MTVDDAINQFVAPVSDVIFNFVFTPISLPAGQEAPVILLWLIAAGLFFTLFMGFPNLRHIGKAFDALKGKHDHLETKKPAGQITRFQALATTLSGTVGLGNIAGVAVAISIGGPGAMVWMIITGLLGMSTKFMESTMAVKYRREFEDGHVSGGPMYYIRDSFLKRGWDKLGLVLAGFFAFCCIFAAIGAGNLFQANQFASQLILVTGGEESFFADKGWLVGLFLAAIVGVVIIGGIESIAKVASKIVPIMGGLYLLCGLIIVLKNFANIPEALQIVFSSAFTAQAGLGGLIGALIQGVQRGAFSNEAGFGTGAMPHAAVKTSEPISQGLVAMIGPFVDTVIICTVTALVIVVSGVYTTSPDITGVQLTSQAFAETLGWFPYLLAVAVGLFAFSTMISWSYYGLKAVTFFFNESKYAELTYKIFYSFCAVIGATASLEAVIQFADAMLFAMTVPNIVCLYVLSREIKGDLKSYLSRIEKA